MRAARISIVLSFVVFSIFFGGCVNEVEDLKVRNRTQQQRINDLEGQLAAVRLGTGQSQRKVDAVQERCDAEVSSLKAEITAVEEAIDQKNQLIAALQGQLLRGGASLPVELNTMLQDFAESSDMVSYDPSNGIVKFKSDLLFQRGSDQVASNAVAPLKALCDILNSKQGKNFDAIIAGHTDDVPIKKPATKAKHPTNWHLSAHRAISVLNMMIANRVVPTRVSLRAFGEYRPIVPNAPNKKGNPKNRRVEIHIIPSGA
jgi:chemotaxis protein MotB